MSDDEIRAELEKVKEEVQEGIEWAGGVPHQGKVLIDSAIGRIDKLLKHFDPGIPLKPKS